MTTKSRVVKLQPLKARHPTTGRVTVEEIEGDVTVGESIKRDIRELPGKIAWYFQLRNAAKDELREARHHEHNVEEELYERLSGAKTKVTDVKNQVKTHPDMRAAYRRRMDAERAFDEADAVVEMMKEKRIALQTYAKLRVAEITTNIQLDDDVDE